jgi:hypothetical protein
MMFLIVSIFGTMISLWDTAWTQRKHRMNGEFSREKTRIHFVQGTDSGRICVLIEYYSIIYSESLSFGCVEF